MKKNILFVLLLSWLLVGCFDQPSPGPSGDLVCTTIDLEPCDNNKNDPKVTLHLDTMTVEPECVNAKGGRVIIFELESADPITKGSVQIIPKDAANDWWLAGTNSPNQKRILVLAPKKKDVDGDFSTGIYSYEVRTPTACLDPRVNVQ